MMTSLRANQGYIRLSDHALNNTKLYSDKQDFSLDDQDIMTNMFTFLTTDKPTTFINFTFVYKHGTPSREFVCCHFKTASNETKQPIGARSFVATKLKTRFYCLKTAKSRGNKEGKTSSLFSISLVSPDGAIPTHRMRIAYTHDAKSPKLKAYLYRRKEGMSRTDKHVNVRAPLRRTYCLFIRPAWSLRK